MAPKKKPENPDKPDKKTILAKDPKRKPKILNVKPLMKRQAPSSDIEGVERPAPVRQGGTQDSEADLAVAMWSELAEDDGKEEVEVVAKPKRTKRSLAKLKEFAENQDAIVDWLMEQKCLYDPGHKDSSNPKVKEAVLKAKAEELGVTCKF